MAETSDEKEKGPSTYDLKQNIDDSSTVQKTLENELSKGLKTKDDFRQFGKSYIENIRASLLASSAGFNREKYAAALEDPYMKAYRYLEENKVLALLEELITCTAFQRPSEPLSFMIKLVRDFYTDNVQKNAEPGEDLLKTYQ